LSMKTLLTPKYKKIINLELGKCFKTIYDQKIFLLSIFIREFLEHLK